jgi:ubiquinone/menaquinone biosynthesis C-methylase UbiE
MPMSDVARLTRELYDRHANEYERSTGNYCFFPGLHQEVEQFCNDSPPGSRLLDLGCGVGRDAQYLASRGRPVVAGDLSLEMLRIAKRRCKGNYDIEFVQLDMTALPFQRECFGGIWVCASLLHIPIRHMPKAIGELFRVAQPGGLAAISMKAGTGEGWRSGRSITDARWFTLVQPDQFRELLLAVGFSYAAVRWSGRRNWFIAEARKPM